MKRNKKEPYSSLATIYDLLMDHVDYKFWANYILKLIKSDLNTIHNVIDISGGTGELISNLPLPRTQFIIADISGPMLTQFKHKPCSAKVPAIINDMRKCALKSGCFDLVLMLYDSFNYLPDLPSVHSMLNETYRILNKNGLLIFDAVSPSHCQKYFNGDVSEQFSAEMSYRRKSYFDKKVNRQHTDFEIILGDGIFYEHHIQQIFPLDEIYNQIHEAKFNLMASYEGFSRKPAKQNSDRVHFVCRKI